MRVLSVAALVLLAGCDSLGQALPVVGESTLVTSCYRYEQAASFLDPRLDDLATGQLEDFARLDRIVVRRCTEDQLDPALAATVVDAATAELKTIAETLP
jgi:hypothetical protein